MFNNLSASSSTKYFKFWRLNPFVFVKWSSNLPGVLTIIAGFLDNYITCFIGSTPPKMQTDVKLFIPASLNLSKYYFICKQS